MDREDVATNDPVADNAGEEDTEGGATQMKMAETDMTQTQTQTQTEITQITLMQV